MPFPLLALALPALIGVVGGVATRWIEGRLTGRPATGGQLLRAGLLGGALGLIGGNAVNLARWLTAPVARATVVVTGAARADETARSMGDFVEAGRLPFGLGAGPPPPTTRSTLGPGPTPPAPTTPPGRPLFASSDALDRLATHLEAGQPVSGQASPSADLLEPTRAFLEAVDASGTGARPSAPPTLGLAGALRR